MAGMDNGPEIHNYSRLVFVWNDRLYWLRKAHTESGGIFEQKEFSEKFGRGSVGVVVSCGNREKSRSE